ncbi:hypothetical protein LCGC14_2392300 [marine sediment metagenome]|uniref:RNase NYN domain-containing protein n=1 Tax=marine sediment metagenome TaxID=412755 RepID=A0A0F9ESD6_9ZZZZ
MFNLWFQSNHPQEVSKMKPKIISDISNIAGYFNKFPPKFENIRIMFNTLKSKYWILGIADWKLFNCIDFLESYKNYIVRRIIIHAPPNIPADILMIREAIESDNLILTNDKLREYGNLFPSESWLESHRVSFDIFDGKFIIYIP